MARVARKVKDKGLLGLIGRYLRAGVLVGDIIQATELGTPQGLHFPRCSPTSSWMTSTRNWSGVDIGLSDMPMIFRILVKSQRAGERVKTSVTRFLTGS